MDTSFIKKYFPVETDWLCEEEVTEPLHQYSSPSWMRGAAKLLDINQEGSDWRALAQYLGYNAYKVEQFEMSLQPSVMMMADWMTTSKNTSLSLEMVISGLEHLGRHDVVSVIREGSHEPDYPSVFISYQWDSQTEVIRIRQYLEEHKISCWMDIGQMGGGDSLYQKVYQAINNCRVVLCCLSPKFVISDWCVKEVLLADLLKKPILPVMVSRTQWPPPGPMSLCLAPLVYTDLAGAGGHGGEGKHADILHKLHGLVLRLEPMLVDPVPVQSVKEPYFCETTVLPLAGASVDDQPQPVSTTPVTSLSPTPLPSHSMSQHYAFTNTFQSQQLSEDISQRRGILRFRDEKGMNLKS